VLARPKARSLWFASYLQTYLREMSGRLTNVRDLATFSAVFLALLASRHGQILNKTDLAATARGHRSHDWRLANTSSK